MQAIDLAQERDNLLGFHKQRMAELDGALPSFCNDDVLRHRPNELDSSRAASALSGSGHLRWPSSRSVHSHTLRHRHPTAAIQKATESHAAEVERAHKALNRDRQRLANEFETKVNELSDARDRLEAQVGGDAGQRPEKES